MVSITDIPLDELARQVRQRFGADEANSHEVAAKMLSIAPILVEDLQAYWEKGTISTKELHGWSMQRLIDTRSMKPLEAILTLDWVVREPSLAIASLERGSDQFARRDKH